MFYEAIIIILIISLVRFYYLRKIKQYQNALDLEVRTNQLLEAGLRSVAANYKDFAHFTAHSSPGLRDYRRAMRYLNRRDDG